MPSGRELSGVMEEQEISGEGRQENGVAKRDKNGVREEG
jgi:hypothetical protein